MRRLFEVLARQRPLLVLLEDVHWAEPTLLDLVEHVSRWSSDAPILLLCVAREELLEERPALGGHPRAARATLDRGGDPASRRPRRPRHAVAGAPRARHGGGPGESALHRAARRHARRGGAGSGRARRAPTDDPGAARRSARPPRSLRPRACSSGPPSSARSSGPARWPPSDAATRPSVRRCWGSSAASSSSPQSRASPARTASASGTR